MKLQLEDLHCDNCTYKIGTKDYVTRISKQQESWFTVRYKTQTYHLCTIQCLRIWANNITTGG